MVEFPANVALGNAMDVRHSYLIEKLSEHGWRVIGRECDDLDWWADEIWTVESEWSPRGFTVFLTWLVDPQWDDHRPPGQAVWAVGTCLRLPADRLAAEGEPLMLIKHWPRELARFLAGLSGLCKEGLS
jgi:hypothetical protein